MRLYKTMLMIAPFYGVSLRMRHPTIDPMEITNQLSIIPTYSWKQGDDRKTPMGQSLDGSYKKSYWCFCYSIPPDTSLSDFLHSCVNQLAPYHDLFHRISKEHGQSEFYVGLRGNVNAGDELQWDLLSRLVELRLNLAIEVFPRKKEEPTGLD